GCRARRPATYKSDRSRGRTRSARTCGGWRRPRRPRASRGSSRRAGSASAEGRDALAREGARDRGALAPAPHEGVDVLHARGRRIEPPSPAGDHHEVVIGHRELVARPIGRGELGILLLEPFHELLRPAALHAVLDLLAVAEIRGVEIAVEERVDLGGERRDVLERPPPLPGARFRDERSVVVAIAKQLDLRGALGERAFGCDERRDFPFRVELSIFGSLVL